MTLSKRVASPLIRKVAVLGAGTMGSRIAAHIANAGVPVFLLDILSPDSHQNSTVTERSKIAISAIELLKSAKPSALYAANAVHLLTPGNFNDDMQRIRECDWIIEAVAENLNIKHALYLHVLQHRRPDAILTTNTSGLGIHDLAEVLPNEARSFFFGTHFFNPPRYMRLLEIIPLEQTSEVALATICAFCDYRLGKSVVRSRDTPNFIANRVGMFAIANAIRLMIEQDLTIEEVDVLTGSALGWPKTGTFRLADIVGIDVLEHVARNFEAKASGIGDERADIRLPSFISTMCERGWLGDKASQGFYKKHGKNSEGQDIPEVLDWGSLNYRPTNHPKFPALELAKSIDAVSKRLNQLLHGDNEHDRAALYHWPLLTELFNYAANRLSNDKSEPAQNIVEIDTAMRTGFNWDLGPFEMLDAVNIRMTTERMSAKGEPIAENIKALLEWAEANGEQEPRWYRDDPSVPGGLMYFDPFLRRYLSVPMSDGIASLRSIKKAHGIVKKNPGASLIDLGHGLAAIELHSKMNSLGSDVVSLITQTLNPSGEYIASFEAFIITGDSVNFSVGANLMQLLLAVQEEDWDEVDLMVRSFQAMTQAIKFCPRPVVAAPYGMCLGGGTEIALHAAARQVHAELYMGLVETGVGLIPAGGGCKEMMLRAIDLSSKIRPNGRGEGIEIAELLKKNFETIGKAVVSTSAFEAQLLAFLCESDRITVNRDRLLSEAMFFARALVDAGYAAPIPRSDIQVQGDSILGNLKLSAWTMREAGYLSDHDFAVANKLASILSGGNVRSGTFVSEQYLLDLEREAFLSLCGERKTQERIVFTLQTGKPLRN